MSLETYGLMEMVLHILVESHGPRRYEMNPFLFPNGFISFIKIFFSVISLARGRRSV